MDLIRTMAATGLLLAASAPAAAAAAKGETSYDPDRQICKSRAVVGSRLKRVRECATAQQWEDMELAERMGLMRKQVNGDPGCSGSSSQSCNPVKTGGRDTPW